MSVSTNLQSIELVHLIAALSPVETNSVHSLSDVAKYVNIQSQSSQFETLKKNIAILVHDLIFKQFANPAPEAVREMVSNALDAQVRSNQVMPIAIILEGNMLKIKDRGDGMNYSSVVNFLVPGRSSNPEAIFNLDNGIPKVTGRFGQGGLAAFFFLLYQSGSHPSGVPFFKVEDNSVEISFICQEGDKNFQMTFKGLEQEDGKINVQKIITPIAIVDHENKSIRIRTFHEGSTPLQMDFEEKENQVLVDVKETTKKKTGTTFKIISPLIKDKANAIVNYLKEAFAFVPNTPLLINKEQINPSEAFKVISFEGGELYFQPNKKAKKGVLVVCEGGKRIIQFETSHPNLFEKVGLSFHRLSLSQERNTLDYSSLAKPLNALVNEIFKSEKLNREEKTALFNALVPLLIEGNYKSVIEIITAAVVSLSQKEVIQTLEFVHSLYIDLKPLNYVKAKENWRLFINNKSQDEPVLTFEKDNTNYIILSDKLFHSQRHDLSLLNQALAELWISFRHEKVKDFSGSVSTKLATPTTSIPPIFNENDTTTDLSRYESMPGADIPFLSEEGKKLYPEDQKLFDSIVEIKELIEHYQTKSYVQMGGVFVGFAKRKCFYYFKDFIEDKLNKKDGLNLLNKVALKLLLIPDLSLSNYHSFLSHTLSVYQKMVGEEKIYFLDGLICSLKMIHTAISKTPFSYQPIYDYYLSVKKLIMAFGYEGYFNFFSHVNPNNISSLEILVKKLNPDLKLKTFDLVQSILGDIQDLIKMPDGELIEFLNCFLDEERHFHPSFSFKAKDYQLLSKYLFSKPYSFEYKKSILFAYYYATRIYNGIEILKGPTLCNFIQLSSTWKNEEIDRKGKLLVKTFHDIEHASLRKLHYLNACYIEQNNNEKSFIEEEQKKEVAELKEINKAFNQNGKFDGFHEFYLRIWEKYELIPDEMRPFVYTAILGDQSQFKSKDYAILDPTAKEPATPLHQDPYVIENVGSEKLAQIRIQAAIKQSLEPHFCFGELIKNSQEAAKEGIPPIVEIEVHTNSKGHLILVFKDNGHGMDQAGLHVLKCPGASSKRNEVNQKNPNFGLGFLSAVGQYDKVYVQSTKDNVFSSISFEKTENTILTRTAPSEAKDGPSGTTIILEKMEVTNLALELILIRCALIAKCRYMQGITITFNGQPLNGYIQGSPIVKHSFPYQGGLIEAQIKKSDGGLYCKGVKIGKVDKSYTSVLPSSVKDILDKEEVHFTLLIPQAEQIRNRGHLTENNALLMTSQKAILAAALKYCHLLLLQDKHFPNLSKDFWYDFEKPNFSLSEDLKKQLSIIQNGFFSDNKMTMLKKNLLKFIQNSFKDMNETLYFPQQNCDATQLISLLEEQLESISWADELKLSLESPVNLALLLLHFPISSTATLFSLREDIKRELIERILNEDGSYDLDYISEESLEDLQYIVFEVIDFNLKDPGLNLFANHFKEAIVGHIKSIKSQQEIEPVKGEETEPLANFLKKAASYYFQKQIVVTFEALPDGKIAKATQGGNVFTVNTQSKELKSFLKLAEGSSSLEKISKNYETIKSWLGTLVHELTHMDEMASSCTHDQAFRDKMAEKLNVFWMLDEAKPSVLDVLAEAFQPIKRGKKRKFEEIDFI